MAYVKGRPVELLLLFCFLQPYSAIRVESGEFTLTKVEV